MSKACRILVADDDADDQWLIAEALESFSEHISLVQVYNGAELLKKLQNESRPDLIILDLNMPVMDGVQVLEKIKSDVNLKDIPVYILSTMRDRAKAEKSKQLGAEQCYSKPNNFRDYRSLLHDIVSEF